MIFEFPQEPQRGVDTEKYTPVMTDDPVRSFLETSFPHFCLVLSSFTTDLLPNYMLFLNVFHKRTGGFYLFSFVEYPVHPVYEPVPPIFVYRKKKKMDVYLRRYFVPGHHRFIMSIFGNQPRDTPIHFVANDQYRDVHVSRSVYEQVMVHKDTNTVPLLVIRTEEASLRFAGIVCRLLHCTDISAAMQVMMEEKAFLDTELSVTPLRKLYDCFPPAYFNLPEYVWVFFKKIDIPLKLQE